LKIGVALYKGEGNWKTKMISWWTCSKYSHAELVMPDEETWISISPLLTSRVSSRVKKTWNEKDWDIFDFEVTSEQADTIQSFYKETEGCYYDWIGMLLSQFLPFKIKTEDKWYCSEWIAHALTLSCVINWRISRVHERADLSPARLHEIIVESL
jgi:hypothetical protein|tara:strand:- start:662 stop:1126 length:465 start_codon:yes stop_codon:yes gene_type:complete